jgi:CRISPR-associated protein Csb1
MKTLDNILSCDRLLIEVSLKPCQGSRFQPTGFPDLGAATFTTPNGNRALLVESPQSMANRLEMACWDQTEGTWIEPLKGVPYIAVLENDALITTSVLESHRINSPYILESKDKTFKDKTFLELVKNELADMERGAVDIRKFARFLLKYDPGCLLHGAFLAKKELAGGRLRIARSLSAFVEAENINLAVSGGVKFDNVDPKGDTKAGFGHVPFHRDEYTAEKITAYFNLDVSQIKAFGFTTEVNRFLVAWALTKIRLFLDTGLRLRTACDLTADEPVVTSCSDVQLPPTDDLLKQLPELIKVIDDSFVNPPVHEVTYIPGKKSTKSSDDTKKD